MNISELAEKTKAELIKEVLKLRQKLMPEDAITNALQQTNAALQDLFENSNDLIFVCDMKGSFLFTNKTCHEKLGYSLETLKHTKIYKLLAPKAKKDTITQLRKLLKNQQNSLFKTILQHQNGRYVYLEGRVSIRYEGNQPVAIRGIMSDTTARVIAENQLISQNARLKAIFESGSHIMWSVNKKRELTSFNQNYVKALQVQYGITPAVNQNLDSLREALKKDGLALFWKEKLKDAFLGKIQKFEVKARDTQGNIVWQDVYLNPIPSENGRIKEVSAIAHDITEQKRMTEETLFAKEFAEKSLKVKESFLANMSHEIRTPMNGIIGMIDLLADTQLSESQIDYVSTIKKSSEILLAILNDILDLSKIEAGKMQLYLKPISLKNTIQKVCDLFQPQANQKHNKIGYKVHKNISGYILADETRILQVLSNFVSNALKFTDNGKILITASPCQKKGNIKISIKDTGMGIAQHDVKKLFENFSQLDNSFSKTYSGTGLGLAICKQLSQLMGGDVGVKSVLGQGSIFWFSIHADQTKVLLEQPEENTENIILTSQNKINIDIIQKKQPIILIVDDNAINRKVAAEILLKAGCDIHLTESGEEALEKVQTQEYDIILMDIQMPTLDGVATRQKIIESYNLKKEKLPQIIAMTAYALREDRNRLLNEGFNDYISKPINGNLLIERIVLCLETEEKQEKKQEKKVYNKSIKSKESTILNISVLKELSQYGGKAFVLETLNEFSEEAEQMIKNCILYLQNNDFENIKSEIHTLKGNAGTLGVTALAQMATKIDTNLKKNNSLSLHQDIKKIQKNFQDFKRLLLTLDF